MQSASVRWTADFSTEITEDRGSGMAYFQSAERKRLSTKNFKLAKISFKNEGEINTFPDFKKAVRIHC